MREKLNENPTVQAALIGLLVIFAGFMLYSRVINRSEPESEAAAPTTAAGVAVPGTSAAAPAATDPAATAVAPASGAPSVSASGPGFKAGPGLPQKVVEAYDAGQVVALLIVRGPGIDDQVVKRASESLRSRGDTTLFVIRAVDVARYSRITRGVDVNRTPALVVVRPKRLTKGPLPTATVSYGAQSAATVDQAVRDALYSGRDDLPYYPE